MGKETLFIKFDNQIEGLHWMTAYALQTVHEWRAITEDVWQSLQDWASEIDPSHHGGLRAIWGARIGPVWLLLEGVGPSLIKKRNIRPSMCEGDALTGELVIKVPNRDRNPALEFCVTLSLDPDTGTSQVSCSVPWAEIPGHVLRLGGRTHWTTLAEWDEGAVYRALTQRYGPPTGGVQVLADRLKPGECVYKACGWTPDDVCVEVVTDGNCKVMGMEEENIWVVTREW